MLFTVSIILHFSHCNRVCVPAIGADKYAVSWSCWCCQEVPLAAGPTTTHAVRHYSCQNRQAELPNTRPQCRCISWTYHVKFSYRQSAQLTSHATIKFFSTPPQSHLVSRFSMQSVNF